MKGDEMKTDAKLAARIKRIEVRASIRAAQSRICLKSAVASLELVQRARLIEKGCKFARQAVELRETARQLREQQEGEGA